MFVPIKSFYVNLDKVRYIGIDMNDDERIEVAWEPDGETTTFNFNSSRKAREAFEAIEPFFKPMKIIGEN